MAEVRSADCTMCCRLCLSIDITSLKSVFDVSLEDLSMQQKISAWLDIEVTLNDKLPTMICPACVEKITSWQSFKLNCLENQTTLEELINTTNSEVTLMNVVIKEEPMYLEILDDQEIVCDIVIKNEPVPENVEGQHCVELPPLLSPQVGENAQAKKPSLLLKPRNSSTGHDQSSRKCNICDRSFSRPANCNKHKKLIHGVKKNATSAQRDQSEASSSSKKRKRSLPQQHPDDSIFYCRECERTIDPAEWAKHKDKHKNVKCEECGKVFRLQTHLKQHKCGRQNKKPRSHISFCEICDKMFETAEQLKEHALTHEIMPILEPAEPDKRGKHFPCKQCDKDYASSSGLRKHQTKIHPTTRLSRRDMEPRRDRLRHSTLELTDQTTPARSLEKDKEKHPIVHRKIFSETKSNRMFCKICDKTFQSEEQLKEHKATHETMPVLEPAMMNEEKKNRFSCKICDKDYAYRRGLWRHMCVKHNARDTLQQQQSSEKENKRESSHSCKHCSKVFSDQNNLKNHMKSHQLNQQTPSPARHSKIVWCDVCHNAFDSAASLKKHKLQGHIVDDEMPVLYDERDETPSAVKKGAPSQPPYQKVHRTLRPKRKTESFACKLCEKTFKSMAALHGHRGWHTKYPTKDVKEKPKTVIKRCKKCNKNFDSETKYEQHDCLRAKPTFACLSCPLTFDNLESLRAHVKQFHLLQELKCPECHRIFDKQNSLDIHLKVHEKHKLVASTVASNGHKPGKSQIYSCSICKKDFDLPQDLKKHTIQAHPF